MTRTATATTLRTHQIDKAHSEVTFQVRHLLTRVRGRFSDFAGTITFDEEQPERSSAELTIQAASVDTNQPDRDQHLRAADFFDVEHFPTLTFKSRAVARVSQNRFAVTGDLTVRGITREVVLPAEYLGRAGDPWGNERVAFEIELTINRKDFGLTWNAALETGGLLVGDEVKIAIAVQAI